jgi:hypothetical protein
VSTQENTGTSFVTKVVVVVVAIGALISFLMPNTDGLARFDTEINRIFVLSFVQNPEGLFMASEIWESERRYDFAIREMRLPLVCWKCTMRTLLYSSAIVIGFPCYPAKNNSSLFFDWEA